MFQLDRSPASLEFAQTTMSGALAAAMPVYCDPFIATQLRHNTQTLRTEELSKPQLALAEAHFRLKPAGAGVQAGNLQRQLCALWRLASWSDSSRLIELFRRIGRFDVRSKHRSAVHISSQSAYASRDQPLCAKKRRPQQARSCSLSGRLWLHLHPEQVNFASLLGCCQHSCMCPARNLPYLLYTANLLDVIVLPLERVIQ